MSEAGNDEAKGKSDKPKAAKQKTGSRRSRKKADELPEEFSIIESLVDGIKGLSGSAVKMASEKTLDQAMKILKHTPEQMELMGKAGTSLKDLREVTGLTLSELSEAIDLKNPDLLKAAEEGKIGLPFEITLRLASFYARNDPIPFIMKYARTYNPRIWGLMKTLGLDKLTLEAERELRFLNIYRSHDSARQLSDEGFERVRAFTQRAFELALHFVSEFEKVDTEEEEWIDP